MKIIDTFDVNNPPPHNVEEPTDEELALAESFFNITASVQQLELGDTDGHPFHGNQYTKVGGDGLLPKDEDKTRPGIQVTLNHTTSHFYAEQIRKEGFDPMHGSTGILGRGGYGSLPTPSGDEAQHAMNTPLADKVQPDYSGADGEGRSETIGLEVTYHNPMLITADELTHEQHQGWDGHPVDVLTKKYGLDVDPTTKTSFEFYKERDTNFSSAVQAAGYDAIIYRDPDLKLPENWGDQIVVFSKDQVRVVDPPGLSSSAAPGELQLVGLIPFLAQFEPVTASIPLEFGEHVGHDFRGNQYTGPFFGDSVVGQTSYLVDGKAEYAKGMGLGTPAAKDWAKISANEERGTRIAHDYDSLPMRDPNAIPAYDAMRHEVALQYDFLTNGLGVKVESVDHDPYKNVAELRADLVDNHHLSVLSTDSTGPHPYLSNEENDQFRAVHDAFGHATIGRGFDRNGEEAAFQSHAQMFTPLATRALATETRGQNSVLVFGGNDNFPPQKLALLPVEDIVAAALLASALLDADDDNRYGLTRCHHTSLGRSLGGVTASIQLELGDDEGHPFHGNQYTGPLTSRIRDEGGMTYDPHTGTEPTTGFIVAKDLPSTFIPTEHFLADEGRAREALTRFVDEHASEYDDPAAMIGIWHDDNPEHDEVVLDVVEQFDSKEEAVQAGVDRNQQAIWDVEGKSEIDTGGTGR